MSTNISIKRIDDHVNFEAVNSRGKSIFMDGTDKIGGKGNGVSPMETLLMGLAGCSGIDVVLILKKMKQQIDDIQMDVSAEIEKMGDYKRYSTINVHFNIWGDIKEKKVEKAIKMSIEKYCSVAKTLEKASDITSTYTLNPEK
ncbi:MAG: OsmC family protein [Saprospiraceae bacterium]|nr:OsmC family protein [Bacteroidia bacterium]NNL93221.1 OsmC family protein [Saprospiraceae bacterium]